MKTPDYTLARVRNNQRRHRQKRRDYIGSLEQKLQDALALYLETQQERTAKSYQGTDFSRETFGQLNAA